MARILVAWQLGSHYGHLIADLPIAEALREAGHHVLFAVRDPRIAAEVLTPAGFDFLPVPLPHAAPAADAPISYSDILLAAGFGDTLTALGLTRSWMSLLALARPDVLVADHAPMALLAAHAAGIPFLPIGSGFTLPPSASPMPSIRTWEEISLEKRLAADRRALAGVNEVLESLGRAPLGALAELFGSGGKALLTTFPELDHYGPREDCVYLGPVCAALRSARQSWQPGAEPRIFAYLRPTVPRVDALLSALEASAAQVLCAMPGATAELIEHFAGTRITMSAAPLPAAALLQRADLTVTYGGQGLIASSLLAGVPLLVMPQTVEQYGSAQLIERLGAGICLGFDRDEPRAAAALQLLLTDRRYRDAARRFAGQHADFDGPAAARRAAELIAIRAAGKIPD